MMRLKSAAPILLFGALGFFPLIAPQQSNAVPIQANTDYNLSAGGVWLTFDLANSTSDYRLEATVKPGGTVKTGAITGTTGAVLGSLDSNILLDFNIYNYNSTNGQRGTQVGSGTATISADYSGLSYNQQKDVAAGLQGKVATDIDVAINGTINGNAFSINSPAMGMFATVNTGELQGAYNNVISAFGNSWNVAFGSVGNSTSSSLDSWIALDSTVLNKNYHISGDIHVNFNGGSHTDVPEPASLTLLGLGGLFAAHRRRKSRLEA